MRSIDYALGHDTGYTTRRLARRRFRQLVKTLPPTCTGILHTGSWTVPPRDSTPGARHFLLCDATNGYWQTTLPQTEMHKASNIESAEQGEVAAIAATEHFFPISEHTAASLREHYGVASEKITIVGTGRGKSSRFKARRTMARTSCLPELTGGGKYGFLVDEATPQAVAAALLDATSNPERLRLMGEAGQKYCLDAFSWERTAALIYQRIFNHTALAKTYDIIASSQRARLARPDVTGFCLSTSYVPSSTLSHRRLRRCFRTFDVVWHPRLRRVGFTKAWG